MKKKIAIIGTQGVPNNYGGFETLVEYLAINLNHEFEITIFCSSKIYSNKIKEYYGCKLEYLPLNANGIQSILYDIVSLLKSYKKFDKILILGSSGGIILPFLKKYNSKFVLNFGGLDWKRSKWNFLTKRFLKISEYLAVVNSNQLIADNIGIEQYILEEYGRKSEVIEYGGDQVCTENYNNEDIIKYPFLNKPYAFSVARIQPDNNVELIIKAFIKSHSIIPLVFVGNWNNSRYGKTLKNKYHQYSNIYLFDAIYEAKELNKLRSNCHIYIHGHSAGGTNPSLVEAMYLGLPITAFSSGFNEYTTDYKALYFSNENQLRQIILSTSDLELNRIGLNMKKIADERYKWKTICFKYAEILKN